MLLLENVDPLLMDQPEDNLDNAFIADRIVTELREAKTSRQFLFATHNANIPVFGDAEWIGVFTAADNQGRLGLEAQGSIDVPLIRDQVASILEGGRDAFIQWIRTPAAQRNSALIAASVAATEPLLDLLEQHLARSPFMAGEHFTMADIPIGCEMHRWWGLPQERPARPALERWYRTVSTRPGARGVLDQPLA